MTFRHAQQVFHVIPALFIRVLAVLEIKDITAQHFMVAGLYLIQHHENRLRFQPDPGLLLVVKRTIQSA
jgi:hypothetical protein